MKAPARRERAVGPVALQPETLRCLLARQPPQRGDGEITAPGSEEAEHDIPEVARPHEAVAARLLEARVELGRRDRRARLAVRQLLENEERARVKLAHGCVARRRPRERDSLAVVGGAFGDEDVERDCRRTPQPRDRLVRSRSEGEEDAGLLDEPARNEPVDRSAVDDHVVRGLASVRLAQSRRRVRRDERDGERHVTQVEDERAGAWIDVARAASLVAVEARCDVHHDALGARGADAPDEHRLGRRHEVDHLDGRSLEIGRRPKHGRAALVRLRPRARRLVEPVDLAVAIEAEAKLAEMLAVIDVRPEEPLDLTPLAESREQRAVAEDRRGTERVPPPGLVERSRDVGLDRHQRSLTVTTGEVETEPSLARATATNETAARAGSRADRRRRHTALRRRCRRASTSSPFA